MVRVDQLVYGWLERERVCPQPSPGLYRSPIAHSTHPCLLSDQNGAEEHDGTESGVARALLVPGHPGGAHAVLPGRLSLIRAGQFRGVLLALLGGAAGALTP